MSEAASTPTTPGAGWRRLRAAAPYILALVLFGVGLLALYHLLAPVRLADVNRHVRAVPTGTLLLALLMTTLAYLSLVGYDWTALRHLGKPLPLPVTITGGLMAYAFGNTIGLSAISGGAVRYRIYSGLGLDGYDVAAVSTFAAMSFGSAATVVGFSALSLHPGALEAVLPFPPSLVRLVAMATVATIVLPVLWASATGKEVKAGRWTLKTPGPTILAGQIVFSLGDIGFSAMTLYLLLPTGDLGFFTFAGIFAAATMAGILSHVPGGVGVFETVIIASLPAGSDVSQAAAALLLYRLTYFLIPFSLAAIVLAIYESVVIARGAAPGGAIGRALTAVAPALRATSALVPIVTAVIVFGSGLLMTFSALLPPTTDAAEALESAFPLAFVEGGALLTSMIGAGLIVLSHGLLRRKSAAFVLTLAALLAGVAATMIHALDYPRALVLLAVAVVLLPFRREFRRRSQLLHEPFSGEWVMILGLFCLSVGFVLFFAYKGTGFGNELWWQFATDEKAPRAIRAGLVLALVLAGGALAALMRSPRVHPAPPGDDDLARAESVVAVSEMPDAAFALTGDKSLLFSGDGQGLVMYGVQGRSWIALGGPLGTPAGAAEAAWAFADAARAAGARPVFYEIGERWLPLMLDLGLNLYKIGEEAAVNLAAFSLDGPERKNLRAAHARALRDGLSLEIAPPPHPPGLMAELKGISDNWLEARKTREKGFSVGRFQPSWLNRFDLALVRSEGRIVAFANVLRGAGNRRVSVDLMRYGPEAPKGVMEFLFTELMLRLGADGCGTFSLGMAPLSGIQGGEDARLWNRLGAAAFRHGGNFYNFEGLRAFKDKFDPEWRPRYVAAPSAVAPFLPLADASLLIAGGAKGLVRG